MRKGRRYLAKAASCIGLCLDAGTGAGMGGAAGQTIVTIAQYSAWNAEVEANTFFTELAALQADAVVMALAIVGVRAWLARGYFIPGGTSQRGGGQAPAFRVARCRTRSLVDIRLGPVGSRQGSSGLVGDPYGSVS